MNLLNAMLTRTPMSMFFVIFVISINSKNKLSHPGDPGWSLLSSKRPFDSVMGCQVPEEIMKISDLYETSFISKEADFKPVGKLNRSSWGDTLEVVSNVDSLR